MNSVKQKLMPLESTHDLTTNLGCSDTTCCTRGNNQQRNPIDATEKYPKNNKDKKQETRKKANTIFNEVRQFAYVFWARERKILLIQQSNTCLSLHTIHEGSTTLFITRESQDFRKAQLDSIPFQKRSPNPIRRSRFVCRSTGAVDRPFPSVSNRNFMHASRSTAPVTAPCYGRLGGRLSGSCARCACRSTGQSVGRPLLWLAYGMRSRSFELRSLHYLFR